MILPTSTEVLLKRWPVSNLVIIGLCTIIYILLVTGLMPGELADRLLLNGWSLSGLVGYSFLHAGFWHLVMNMLYLWVFGNAVCEKMVGVVSEKTKVRASMDVVNFDSD